jgi:hypothetical protein
MKTKLFKLLLIIFISTHITHCDKSDDSVNIGESAEIEETKDFIFYPSKNNSTVGFIFYPGALIASSAYSDWHQLLAAEDVNVFSIKFPSNLAFFDINAALRVIRQHPDITSWYLGGHSLGGAMALQLISKPPNYNLVKGIVLFGAYPGSNVDFSQKDLQVLTLYGSKDGVSTIEEIVAGKSRMPTSLEIVSTTELLDTNYTSFYKKIEGGNHSNFGNYNFQKGDSVATISREVQQQIMVEYTKSFISSRK